MFGRDKKPKAQEGRSTNKGTLEPMLRGLMNRIKGRYKVARLNYEGDDGFYKLTNRSTNQAVCYIMGDRDSFLVKILNLEQSPVLTNEVMDWFLENYQDLANDRKPVNELLEEVHDQEILYLDEGTGQQLAQRNLTDRSVTLFWDKPMTHPDLIKELVYHLTSPRRDPRNQGQVKAPFTPREDRPRLERDEMRLKWGNGSPRRPRRRA